MDDLRRKYIREKGYKIEKTWKCEWRQNFKTNKNIKNHIRSNFPSKDFSLLTLYYKKEEMDLFMDIFSVT